MFFIFYNLFSKWWGGSPLGLVSFYCCLVWFCECQFELMDLSISDLLQPVSFVTLVPTFGHLWTVGGLFRLGPKYFAHTLEVFARFFCFVLFFGSWCERMFLAHFVQHLLQPWNHPFLQAALVSFSVKWYSKTIVWMLEVLIALGFCFLAFSLDKVRIYFLR